MSNRETDTEMMMDLNPRDAGAQPILPQGALGTSDPQFFSSTPPDRRTMTLDQLADWAGERANLFRLEGFHCSEAVLRSGGLALGLELPDVLLRVSTGFRGGGGGYGDRCGALNSGAMLISLLYGRLKATEDNTCASELTKLLHQRFDEELGATRCSLLNRVYSKQVPDGSCSIVYAAGARMVVRLLGEAAQHCSACAPVPSLATLKKS